MLLALGLAPCRQAKVKLAEGRGTWDTLSVSPAGSVLASHLPEEGVGGLLCAELGAGGAVNREPLSLASLLHGTVGGREPNAQLL